MARIPEAEIERLKSEISLERLVEAAGIELKKAGADLTGCFPKLKKLKGSGSNGTYLTPSI
jgi:DNA primase